MACQARVCVVTCNPDTRSDYTDVRDVVRAYRLLADRGTTGVVNVCSGRTASAAELVAALARRLAERPAAEWLARLAAVGVPAGIVRTVLETVGEAGGSAETGMPPSVPGGRVRLPPPGLDEHGTEIRRIGWAAFADRVGSAS